MRFQLGELFCGPGGLALGAVTADIGDPEWKIVHQWANDRDEDTCRTYRRNICPDRPESVICADVRSLDLGSLGPIDAFAFGFPCNDFSVLGEKQGLQGRYGPLYSYGIEILRLYRPLWFLGENVGGLSSTNAGTAFEKILKDMREAGYELYPHLYRFEKYGVPQRRHRIIIVGMRRDLGLEFHVPSPKLCQGIDISVRSAIEKPPIAEGTPNHEFARVNETVVERLKWIKPGQNVFTADMPEELRLKVKGATISQLYRRLRADQPSYTVIGNGGGGMQMYHWSENRALTNREKARLQTFPDDFIFEGGVGSARRQIGMAVPPRGARVIFEGILRTFAGIEYEFVEGRW